jgi:alpha-tubulin suppressor-like RCC1 family protein
VPIPGATGSVTAAAAGSEYSLVATSGGQLYGFGENSYGQLGVSASSGATPTPQAVILPAQAAPVSHIAAGLEHTLVLTAAGQLYSFGENCFGQLGVMNNVGTYKANSTPILFTLPGQVGQIAKIAAGDLFSLALTSAGQLFAFGDNYYGQLGNSTGNGVLQNSNPTPTPVALPGQSG